MLLSRRSVNRAPNLHSKVGAEVVKKEGNSSRSSKSQHGKSASSSSRHDGTGERLLSARLLSAWLSTWLLSARLSAARSGASSSSDTGSAIRNAHACRSSTSAISYFVV